MDRFERGCLIVAVAAWSVAAAFGCWVLWTW